MKKFIKYFSALLAVLMIFTSSTVALASTQSSILQSDGKYHTYTHNTKFDTFNKVMGIDVSEHNKTIDFNAVKANGIDFVYVRVGYTGYTKKKFSLNYDKYYDTYINDALTAGLQVGVYWYSQALNVDEAAQEANMLLSAISNPDGSPKYNITMPVVDDYEFASQPKDGRLDTAGLSKDQMTANVLSFVSTISQRGYTPCLYANKTFLEKSVSASQIAPYAKIWLAHYNTVTGYAGDYECWQFTSSGKVSGISTKVDMNVWYQGATPAPAPVPVVTPPQPEPQPDTTVPSTQPDTSATQPTTQPTTVPTTVAPVSAAKVTNLKVKSKTNTTITFTWKKQDGVDYYNIYKYDSSSDSYIHIASTDGNVNNIKISKLPEGTYFRFKVTAVANGEEGSRSEPCKVVTNPRKVQTKLAKSNKKKKITFKWKKTTGTGYQYQWSTSKNFKTNYLTKTTKKTNVTISTSQSKKTYYVRVRAYKTHSNGTKYYGKWSTVKKVKVR